MPTRQGSLSLLRDPVALELLESKVPAKLAYNWTDGTPRVVPIWFSWNGSEIVLGTPPRAPKIKALIKNPRVAVTIDGNTWPYKVLLVRGTADVKTVDGIVPEYAASARRYFGEEEGNAWLKQVGAMSAQMVRVAIKPEWVAIIDFQTRFPSAIS